MVRLTIAWEITWYQWEVAASGRGHEVRESGKGETIDQLRTPDRAWNLMAATDGTLEEKTASATPVGGSLKLTVHVDGGSRGNPGPAAIAAVISDGSGELVDSAGQVIGRATNNVAEYRALILGIERAAALGATELDLVGDSELIVKQVRGEYKVKDPNMKPLHAAVDDGAAPPSTPGRSATSSASRTPRPIASSTRRSTPATDPAAGAPAGRPARFYTSASVRL